MEATSTSSKSGKSYNKEGRDSHRYILCISKMEQIVQIHLVHDICQIKWIISLKITDLHPNTISMG